MQFLKKAYPGVYPHKPTRIAAMLRASTLASSTSIATRASARIAEMSRSPVASVSRIKTATTHGKQLTPYPKKPKQLGQKM